MRLPAAQTRNGQMPKHTIRLQYNIVQYDINVNKEYHIIYFCFFHSKVAWSSAWLAEASRLGNGLDQAKPIWSQNHRRSGDPPQVEASPTCRKITRTRPKSEEGPRDSRGSYPRPKETQGVASSKRWGQASQLPGRPTKDVPTHRAAHHQHCDSMPQVDSALNSPRACPRNEDMKPARGHANKERGTSPPTPVEARIIRADL